MQKIIPYIIATAFLALIVIAVIYISRKFAWVAGADSPRYFYILFTFLASYAFVASGVFTNATGALAHQLYRFGAILLGVYLFLLLSVLLTNLVHVFSPLSPRMFGIISIALTLIMSIAGTITSINTRITSIDIPTENLTQDFRLVHLSDVHIGHFRTNGYIGKIVDRTNEHEPDAVLITGDYLDSKYALQPKYFKPLENINAPVFFVGGNHDHMTDLDSIQRLMRKAGVSVLENEVVIIGDVQIVGLKHMLADHNTFDVHAQRDEPTIEETLKDLKIDSTKTSVLMHHAPGGIEYASKSGIDLYLSGHTHAGQIFPFNFISGLMFDYNRGLHEYDDTKIFVSQGIGTFGPPFRIGTKSEIVVIDLKKK